MGIVANPNNKSSVNKAEKKPMPQHGGEREFYIEYNPYRNETKFSLNGKNVGGGFETYRRDFRLQQYLEKREGWNGLFDEIVKKCNSSSVKVIFKGRDIDFDDLKLCLDESGYADNIKLEFIPAQKNDNDMFSDIGKIIANIKNTEIDELKTNSMIETAYKDALDSQLKVSVVATMSSGKSTLINSLLGQELLPSQNEACTATVARILDDDYADKFNCVCKNKDGEIIEKKDNVTKEDLELYNEQGKDMDNDDPKKIIFMDIDGPVPGVTSDKIKLLLQDTPGPNNSRDKKHKELTEDMIKDRKNSIILYVMNATQLRVDDDYKLLNLVSTAMRNGGKQTRDRFLFVINKFDALDLEKEDSLKTIQATKDYLNEFGIEQPNVFPVSAYAALLIRKSKAGAELSRKERKDLGTYITDFGDPKYTQAHFEKLADLSPAVRKKLEKRLKTADEQEMALIHTGIPAIEETINEYLEKYAYPIKVNDAVSELQREVRELDMERRFNESIISSSETRKSLQQQVEDAEKKQLSARNSKEQFKKRIDEFNLDTSEQRRISSEVTRQTSDITDKFMGETDVEEAYAKILLRDFTRSVESLQDRCESQLKTVIENGIKEKGNKMSREYSELVSQMFRDIKIEGFDFSNIGAVDRYIISDMNSLMDKNKRYEDIEEEYTIDNPERSGFWGKLKFWKPKTVTRRRVVGQKAYVDVQNVVIGEMTEIEAILKGNIRFAFDKGKHEIEQYKRIFKRNLDKLDGKIREIIREQKDKISNIDKLASEIKDNTRKLAQIQELASKINNIMEF